MACRDLKYFSTLTQKGRFFEKKRVFENKMFVLIFSRALARNISYSKKDLTMIYHEYALVFIQSTCYSCAILMRFKLSCRIKKYSVFMKILQPSSFHVDGQTDRQAGRHDETNSRFTRFCENS